MQYFYAGLGCLDKKIGEMVDIKNPLFGLLMCLPIFHQRQGCFWWNFKL